MGDNLLNEDLENQEIINPQTTELAVLKKSIHTIGHTAVYAAEHMEKTKDQSMEETVKKAEQVTEKVVHSAIKATIKLAIPEFRKEKECEIEIEQ